MRGKMILVLALLGLWSVAAAAQGAPSVAERLGYPVDARLLVIHADDLGMMRSVNRATFEALEKRWITSASVLVVCPWFPEVARFAKEHPEADLGIHLAVNSEWTGYRWGPVSARSLVPTLLDADGYMPILEEITRRQAVPVDVERELHAQAEKARAAGIRITHFDSHMGTLFQPKEFFDAYARVGRAYGAPILVAREDVRQAPPGSFSAEQILVDRVLSIAPGVPISRWLETYQEMLRPLPPGVYQLIVHLGYDDEELRGATWDHVDWGAAWRQADFDLVRNPEFQRFLRDEGFILVGWKDLARALPQAHPIESAR